MSKDNESEIVSDERFEVEVFGQVIGTADGWDDFGDCGQQFTAFKVSEAFKGIFPSDCTLAIDYQTGNMEFYTNDEEGEGIAIELEPFLQRLALGA